jgi:hypothetical protein
MTVIHLPSGDHEYRVGTHPATITAAKIHEIIRKRFISGLPFPVR